MQGRPLKRDNAQVAQLFAVRKVYENLALGVDLGNLMSGVPAIFVADIKIDIVLGRVRYCPMLELSDGLMITDISKDYPFGDYIPGVVSLQNREHFPILMPEDGLYTLTNVEMAIVHRAIEIRVMENSRLELQKLHPLRKRPIYPKLDPAVLVLA